MRKLLHYCAAAALAIGVSSARGNFINFESVPTGVLAPDALASYGISSISQSGSGIVDPVQCRYMAGPDHIVPSGVNMFMPAGYWYPNQGTATTTLEFSTPVNSFSFKKLAEAEAPITVGIAGWKVEAFDESSTLVDSDGINLAGGLDFPSPGPINQSFALSGSTPIKTVVFTVNFNYMSSIGTVPVDDFQFDPIPEPALGGAALVLHALCRRHRIRQIRD